MTITDAITAISVAIAAGTFFFGVQAWKREFIGKRKIELVETVLALFYEAEDAIRDIRSPFSYGGEGKSRNKSEDESKEESVLLDRAYIVFERYRSYEKLFSELRSLKYRMMAMFGPSAGRHFDELKRVVNDIFLAAEMLGTHYWQRQGRAEMDKVEFKQHLKEKHEYEAIFWYRGEKRDTIGPRVHDIIVHLEDIAEKEAKRHLR